MSPARLREWLSRYGILLAFVVLAAALSILSPSFLEPSNLLNVLRQISVNALLAFGMTTVIVGGGIDLSVGSVLAFSGALAAGAAMAGWAPALAMIAALVLGAGMGLVNGFFVAGARIAPFIATLGGLTIFRGATLVYTDGRPITGLPDAFGVLGNGAFGGVPVPVWVMLGFLALTHFLLRYTGLGRNVYAVGGNEEAARLSGLPIVKVKLFTYAYAGLASALGALVLTGRLNSAQPTAGSGFELDAIAAVVVGGTSLSGGRGSVLGTFVGAAIIGVLNNGMNLLNVSAFYQQIVKGGVILGALLIDRLVATRKE
ncbi:ABC transporter permease [Anaeromyxobacter oryzae]|uniref:Ribose ABC transporter permease n=1 Tax=Anaeromyxobacter oryzae TaxID=2918170 RepID=A0ABM7WP65_9BACT|nr:ribose ABC transporter permease [Anaeromyxobacter oryzae]BDG01248.1 ribose ABC transporter permease [Anaeromyxobacter oryzae]